MDWVSRYERFKNFTPPPPPQFGYGNVLHTPLAKMSIIKTKAWGWWQLIICIIIALSWCPKLHELDLVYGNQRPVRVLEGSASKWDRVATRLYFDGNMISRIWIESQNDQLRACRNAFTQWLDGNERLCTPRTWKTVIEVLKEAGLGQLANDLTGALQGTIQEVLYNWKFHQENIFTNFAACFHWRKLYS